MVAVNLMVLRSPGASEVTVCALAEMEVFSSTRMFLISTLPELYSSYCTVAVLPLRTTSGSMVRLTVRRGAVPVKVSAALALRDLTTTLPLASTSL